MIAIMALWLGGGGGGGGGGTPPLVCMYVYEACTLICVTYEM